MNCRTVLSIVMFTTCLASIGCATTGNGTGSMFARSESAPKNQFAQEISLARLSERNGAYPTAKKLYRHVLAEQPNHQLALHRMGVIAGREGEYETSVEYLTKASTVGDPSAELLSDLGYVYYLQDNQELAQATLEKALATDPDYKAARSNLGIVYAELGQYDVALNHFRRVSSEAEAYSNLAYIQSQRGDIELAEKNYIRALDIDKRLRPAAEALVQIAQVTGEVSNRPEVRPHVIPSAEPQAQPELVAEASPAPQTTIPTAASMIANQSPLASATPAPAIGAAEAASSNNPLRTASRFSESSNQGVQQVQYSADTRSALPATSATLSQPSSGLKIPTETLGTAPAVYQISDQPTASNVQKPAAAASSIGATPSASAQNFSNQVLSALQTAASSQQ